LVVGAALAIGKSSGSASATKTVTVPANTSTGSSQGTAQETRSTTSASAPSTHSVEEGEGSQTTPYHGTRFSAAIPTGWTLGEDELQKPKEVESTWISSANPSDFLLIDVHSPTHLTPEQDAAPVHRDLEESGDYIQLYYGSGDLTGVSSWMWIFRHAGSERVDYFFETCANSIAVLGSTTPARFDQLRGTFRAVAQSVRSNCD
jgi:hypothetical protein